jgi:hypothetical protein
MISDVLVFVILSMSVSYAWSYAKVTKPLRNLVAKVPYLRVPLLCPDCSSFWFGLLVSFVYNPVLLDIHIPYLSNIFCGLVAHLFASFLYKIKNTIEVPVAKPTTTTSIDFVN